MTRAPRVLIADDHPATRAGVRMALERDGIEVCAEAATASQAVEAALRERPDACLLDVNMPGGGISAASMITFKLPDTVVLMLTVSRDDTDLFESLRRGASGYLLKDGDPTRVPLAVRGALDGEAPLSGELTAQVIDSFRQRPRARRIATHPEGRPDLTAREWEVMELLVEGASTAEMAKRLFLSQVTVRRHVSNILGKLGVSSREEAVQLALGDETSAEADAAEDPGAGEPPAPAEPTVEEPPRRHAVRALTYERPVSKPPAARDAVSTRSAELERALADIVAAERRTREELEQSRRENEQLRSQLHAEADGLSAEAQASWSRMSRLVDELAQPEPPETPPPGPPADLDKPPADLDELARTSLRPRERAIAGDALERLPRLLDAGERAAHLSIGEYDATVGLVAVTDRRLLMVKPDDAMYQAFPYSDVSGVERHPERFGRGSLRITTRHGDLVLKSSRMELLEPVQLHVRERISTAGGSPSSPPLPSSA